MIELAKQYKVIIVVIIIIIITIVSQTGLFKSKNQIELIGGQASDNLGTNKTYYAITDSNSIYNSNASLSNQGYINKDEFKKNSGQITLDQENGQAIGNLGEVSVTESAVIDKITVIPVYICGEIVNPGVYNVNSDKLINDVVNLAGGLTEDANPKGINLAEVISANDMIIIPKIGEELPEVKPKMDSTLPNQSNEICEYEIATYKTSNLVNINTASKDDLMSLPGIGEVKAQAIIDYRESISSFMSISDIKEVSGIGDKTFEKLVTLITI